MKELTVKTSKRNEIVDITGPVGEALPRDMTEGICFIYCPHTTAAITVNENYDPDVKHDLLTKLERLIPHGECFYLHNEGNSDAHLKSSVVGVSQMVPFRNGQLELGTWQGIYFCEFDGPRTRKLRLYFQKTEE
ncbi:MAG: YjbQ family protein [Lentisphaeria bacterium]|nr:YjbQ family protein [Lentisphaeria bacterium]